MKIDKDGKETFTVEDVLEAGFTLEPLICKYCGSRYVIFNQGVGDAYCEECGKWQLEEERKNGRKRQK